MEPEGVVAGHAPAHPPRSGLPPEAYEEVPPEQYPPYIPAEIELPELTFRAVVIGLAIAVVFGAANAYLGLRVGLTVSASIPAAVIGVAMLRTLRGGNVLEGNIVQTIGSSGESLAAGVIFTIPALFIWGMDVRQLQVFTLAALGGLLGVLIMIPLRRYLIVREHGRLPYPEGTAAAEVLAAGDTGGAKARLLFTGLGIGIVLALLPESFVPVGFLGAGLMLLFAVVFVTVSSRIVGLIGNSTNPISGMTIATLLGTSLIFVATGAGGADPRVAILSVGAVVCIAAAIAGDASQDLKTGFLLGSTPRRQQIGEIVGVLVPATLMGVILIVLHEGVGIGSEDLPAPQATLMALVIDGVVSADLPWNLVAVGAVVALVIETLGIPSLPLAVGMYLPLSLQTSIMAGGLVRLAVEWRFRDRALEVRREKRENGVLFASGLIAGAALVGVLIAGIVFAAAQGYPAFERLLNGVQGVAEPLPAIPSLVIFAGLAGLLGLFAVRGSGGEIGEPTGGGRIEHV